MYTHIKIRLLVEKLTLLLLILGIQTIGHAQVATNQCISLGNVTMSSKVGLPIWAPTLPSALSDGSDNTIFEVNRPVDITLGLNSQNSSKDLILHWRSASYESRGLNNDRGFHQIKIYGSNDGVNWNSLNFHVRNSNGVLENKLFYESIWQDDYVLFENTHQQWIKIEELDPNSSGVSMQLSRLEIFTSAPDGYNDDIWLFMGNSETNGNMGVGSTNQSATTYFSDKILHDNPCYYPIVLNGGYGGEAAVTVIQEEYLVDIFTRKPEISFVPFCYGLNDIMRGTPTPVLTPYGENSLQTATEEFTNAYSEFIDIIIADATRIAIPSRIPWVFVPNDYCPSCTDPSTDFTYGTRPFNIGNGDSDFEYIDNIIQIKTPYAINPATNLAYADFDTWFYDHKYDYHVFKEDKVHHGTYGIDQFNKIWVETAEKIVYAPNVDVQLTESINDGNNDGVIDNGTSVTLAASGGTQFMWTNGSSTSSITITPVQSEVFSVTITDGNCTYIRDIEIVVRCANYTITQSGGWNHPVSNIGTITIPNEKELFLENIALDFCQDGKIVIENGGKLTLGKGVGLAASDVSWLGIELIGSNSAFQSTTNAHWGEACLIADAVVGVRSETALIDPIKLDNIVFRNNDISIYLVNSEALLTGCQFKDDRFGLAGVGIQAINSKLEVVPDKLTDPNNWKRPSFEHLKFGIILTTDGQNEDAVIEYATFDLCGVGIHNHQVSSFKIRHNHFIYGQDYTLAGSGYYQKYQYGILMSGAMPGFTLEGNRFDFNGNAYTRAIGIQVTQLGENENMIRANHFEDMVFANVAFGVNGKTNEISGLQYACNQNHDNTVSIVTGTGTLIRAVQGKVLPINLFQAVDNQVLNGCDWDFYHQGNAVEYYYSTQATKPVNYHGITPESATEVPDCTVSARPGDGFTQVEKELNEKAYLEKRIAYESAKDAWEIAKQTNDELLIKQKLGAMTVFSEALGGIAYAGYVSARNDVQIGNRDEVRKWIRRFGTFSGDLMLAVDYAKSEDWSSVHSVLSMIPQKYDMDEFMMEDLDAVTGIYDMLSTAPIDNLSSSSLMDLDDLAKSGIGYAAYQARSIMSRYGYIYQPLGIDAIIEQQFIGNQTPEGSSESSESGPKLKTSPNPADYNVLFDWREFVIESNKQVTIEISNKMGSLVQILQPSMGEMSIEWTTEAVSSGLIYYRLLIDGQEMDSGQVLINK